MVFGGKITAWCDDDDLVRWLRMQFLAGRRAQGGHETSMSGFKRVGGGGTS